MLRIALAALGCLLSCAVSAQSIVTSTTPGRQPSATEIAPGQIYVNRADGTLSFRRPDGAISASVLLDTPAGILADGTSDNYPAMQAAIDAASARGGGRVVIPPGRTGLCYGVSQALRARSGVKVEATGACIKSLGGGSTPYAGNFPTGGVLLAGIWSSSDFAGATPRAISAVAMGDASVTLTTASQASGFAVGDVVLVSTTTTWEIAGGAIPVSAQMNIVTSVNIGTGAIGLRHSADVAISGAQLFNLSNSGQTWIHTPTGAGDVPQPHWAVRDFEWRGGTLISGNPQLSPVLYGGLIDSVIDVERTQGGHCVAYGNLLAYSRVASETCLSVNGGIEVSLLSHDNLVDVGALSFVGATNTGRRGVWVNEGARDNLVRVRSIEAGDVEILSIAEVRSALRNRVEINSATAKLVTNAIQFAEYIPGGGNPNRPWTEDNTITISRGRFATISTTIYGENTGGRERRNRVIDTRISGTSGTAVYWNGSAGDTLERSRLESGAVLVIGSPSVPNRIEDSYVAGGLPNDANLLTLTNVIVRGLQTAATEGAAAVTRVFDGGTVTSSAPYTATVTVPAGLLNRRGVQVVARALLQVSGTAGTKRVLVTYGGTAIFDKTIPAAVTGAVDFALTLRTDISEDAFSRSTLLADGQPAMVGLGYIPGAGSQADLVIAVSCAAAGDTVYVRGLDTALRGLGLQQGGAL